MFQMNLQSLEITDYDNECVNLKWTKQENDGGAPIEKYIIEKKAR